MNYSIFGSRSFETLEAMQYDILARPSLAAVYPGYLPWSNASLRPAAIQLLLNDIMLNHRVSIVEFGSGLSTVMLATFAAARGGQVVSFDHEPRWQEQVLKWIPPEAASAVRLEHAPLAAFAGRDGPARNLWYDAARVRAAVERMPPVDLVLVDGPPAYEPGKELARLPAVEVLQPYLSPSVTVVLDDIMRAGEQAVAAEWTRLLGLKHRDLAVQAGVGLWCVGGGLHIAY